MYPDFARWRLPYALRIGYVGRPGRTLSRLKGLLVPERTLFNLADTPTHAPAPTILSARSVLPVALAAVLGDQPLNEMQQAALPALLDGRRNLIVGARTGAGKTRLAEIALVEAALQGDAGLFLAPMRAIAGEKQADWQ